MIDDLREQIVVALRGAGARFALLHGSRAAGTHRPDSVGIVDLGPDDDGRRSATFVRFGDSTARVRAADGTWCSPFAVKNEGESIASAATSALPHVTGFETAHSVLADGEVLVLMTNGIGDALDDGRGDVGRFLAEAWQHPPSDLAFAAQVEFARRSFDDDRTAVACGPEGIAAIRVRSGIDRRRSEPRPRRSWRRAGAPR